MKRRDYLKALTAGTLSTGLLMDGCTPTAETTPALPPPGPVSQRGLNASVTAVRVDMDLYFEAAADLYHARTNPQGKFPVNVAENRLSWNLLKARIEQTAKENPVEEWVANYTASVGALTTRKVFASFLEKFLTKCPIDPEHLCMGPGAAAVIEQTCWVLGDPGDVAVIPAPAYSVYTQDIGNRPGLERYDLFTHEKSSELRSGSLLTTEHLDKALNDISSKGKRFRILILTSPDNPTGIIYTRDQLVAYADWCIAHKIHLVVNEIYGLSMLDTSHPDLKDDYPVRQEFISFANIIGEKKSDYLHWWYSLSKDFGVSGFRVGVMYSLNDALRKAYNNLNAPSMVSNYAQWTFEKVLADHDFVSSYIKANQQVLTENYAVAVARLRKLNIPYSPARGSLFVWLDLSEFMSGNTADAEHTLWMDLFKRTGVLLTPGDGFGHSRRGQFRLVYSYVDRDELTEVMSRVETFINDRRKA